MNIIVMLMAVLLRLASLKSRLATALSDVFRRAARMVMQDHLFDCASVVCALKHAIYRLPSCTVGGG